MLKKAALLTSLVLLSAGASASEFMTGQEIESLFANKTFDIHTVQRDKHLHGYDSADGIHLVHIPWKNKVSKREWWVENDMHCTSHPKRGDSCKKIKAIGDGSYYGYTGGEHSHTLSNFREGNHLKM